ncbi:MAG: RNA 2',3'-cyclic phosphodiesterase [Flavobacteriales bacterium]|nr:RNA 2',3'-cyclic phosphodiesterase [Flavobacteriales bacterium]
MRLFLGTAVPLAIAKDVRDRTTPFLPEDVCCKAPLEQWHITAIFIGERQATSLSIIRDAAAHLASITAPITIEHGRLTTMPKETPSMMWVRFVPSPALTALHVALAFRTGSRPSVYRPYWPHITLARTRKRNVTHINGDPVIKRMRLNELTLFRSLRGPNGSVHEILENWPFTGTCPVDHEVGV